jgi:hypothetical protein
MTTQSSSKKVAIIIVVIAVIIAVPLIVLASRRTTRSADPASQIAFNAMTSDLHGLAMAQVFAKRQHGRYLADPEQLGVLQSPGVTVPTITLADTGWAATVGSKTIPGIRCAIGVYTKNPIKRFAKSGEVVCE